MENVFPLTLGLLNLGGGEIVLILCVVLLLFGAKRLPELAKGAGKAIKEFKKATSDVEEEIRSAVNSEPAKTPPPPVEKKAEVVKHGDN
ncbi:MAG TPA: twin-arginine translocase TatA/TatE family subunit [Opitutaceae bacterium]|nr:twin-arginine translocase TatA/TatE family subunit [Opitutaceae bacterium]